jgi:hypothetical protein
MMHGGDPHGDLLQDTDLLLKPFASSTLTVAVGRKGLVHFR